MHNGDTITNLVGQVKAVLARFPIGEDEPINGFDAVDALAEIKGILEPVNRRVENNALRIVVIVEGGVVQEALAPVSRPCDMLVWDWDNFKDAPVETWEDYDGEDRELLRQLLAPEVYAEILAKVAAEKAKL